jgi:hypothetical protein
VRNGYETDGVFEVKYQTEDGKKRTATYYAESKSEAQKLFNAEKEPGERLLSVKKVG